MQIRAVIEAQGIKIYQPPIEEDDEAAAQHARSLMVRSFLGPGLAA